MVPSEVRRQSCVSFSQLDQYLRCPLFRLAAELLRAIEAGVFHPVVGWQCKECPFRSRCWAWG